MGEHILLDASNLSIPGIHKFRWCFVGPFLVTARIGEVSYHLNLKIWSTHVHPVFHVSLLRRFLASGNGIEPPEPIEVKNTYNYIVERLLVHQCGL